MKWGAFNISQNISNSWLPNARKPVFHQPWPVCVTPEEQRAVRAVALTLGHGNGQRCGGRQITLSSLIGYLTPWGKGREVPSGSSQMAERAAGYAACRGCVSSGAPRSRPRDTGMSASSLCGKCKKHWPGSGEGRQGREGSQSRCLIRPARTVGKWRSVPLGKPGESETVFLKVSGSRPRLFGVVVNLLSISFVKDNTNVPAMSNCSQSS